MGNFRVNVIDKNSVVLASHNFTTFREAKSFSINLQTAASALRNGGKQVAITEDDQLVECRDL